MEEIDFLTVLEEAGNVKSEHPHIQVLMSTTISVVTVSPYIVINYIPHPVYFIPVPHLFCNCKFVLVNLPHPFLLPAFDNHLFVLCIYRI